MFSCKVFFPALLLMATCSAQAAGLDLSYPQPPLPATTQAPAPESDTPKLKLPFKPAISYEYRCSGQCTYETNIDQLHDRETRHSSSIGFD
ncbi:hypothetical protein GGD92_01050 [Pseudomonas protegens]|uniref:C2H2-type domain-containing protein n=1 Tax=Pseudomonas protegens TaxID=380021 RepID=A0A7G7XAB6_9PSED|nr:hypothetical protein [Pseudomonas protegens]QNH76911.1 hypothetical protein GGI48_27185 [Pseudomonas protegens]QNL06106.1 hypothetical protein GGD92_01050 [Pseudomonas protegens]